MTLKDFVDGTVRNDCFHRLPPAAPTRFLVTSRGASATRWLSFALASHPSVFVAHGKHALESIRQGNFNSERRQDDTASLALGNVMSDFYRCRSFGEVFDTYGYLQPGAHACGNVHTYNLEEACSRFSPVADLTDVRVVNVIRHPVTFIASHAAMARSGQRYPALSKPWRREFELAVEVRPELLLLDHNDTDDFEAFVVSCHSVVQCMADLRNRSVPHVKMEEVTSDVDRLVWCCEYLTRLSYDRERLTGFIHDGPINRHRQTTQAVTPHDVFGEWNSWQRTAAALILPEELLEQFEAEGYDVAMLRETSRPALGCTESKPSGSGTALTIPPAVPTTPALSVEPPVLVEHGYRGFNTVRYRELYIAVAQSLGPVDLAQVGPDWWITYCTKRAVFIGDSQLDEKRQVDHAWLISVTRA